MNLIVPVAPPDPAESVVDDDVTIAVVDDVAVLEAFDSSVTRGAFLSLPILRLELEAALLIIKSDNRTTDPDAKNEGKWMK